MTSRKKMIPASPPNSNQSTIKEKLRSKVHTSETILKMMTTPSRDVCSAPAASQVTTHVEYIERMKELANGVTIDLIHIGSSNRNHVNDTELKNLAKSMVDIGHRASINYKDWRIWKDPITKLQTAIKEVQDENDHRQLEATQDAIRDNSYITLDCTSLEDEVMEHRNYHNAEDHVITKGMGNREAWREQMEQINREFSNLTTTTTNNKIPHKDVDMNALESKVNTLQKLLAEVIKSIEEAALAHLGQIQVPDEYQEQVRKEPKSHQIGRCQARALQDEPAVGKPQAHGDHHSSYQQPEALRETHTNSTTSDPKPHQLPQAIEPQTSQMEPSENTTKLSLPRQAWGTEGDGVIYEHHGPLIDKNSPTTPPKGRGALTLPTDATMIPSKVMNPQTLPGEVVNEDITALDVGKEPPEPGEGHRPSNTTTTLAKTNDPYTITNREPGRHDNGMPDIKTRHNPLLPHQVEATNRVDITYEHHGPLSGKNGPTTPLASHRETYCPPDATITPSEAIDPHTLLGETFNEDITALDVGKYAPKPGEGHHPYNDATTPTKANDPYTITNEELGRHDTGMPDIMNRHNPSLKPYTDINDKKYTIVTEIQRIH